MRKDRVLEFKRKNEAKPPPMRTRPFSKIRSLRRRIEKIPEQKDQDEKTTNVH